MKFPTWFALLAALNLPLAVNASTITYEFSDVFSSGSVAPDGPAPYLTAVFDDGNTPGSVTLTMTIANTVGAADVEEVYFNFDPLLDLNALTFTYNAGSSTGPATGTQGDNGIFTGVDAFQADGDGKYDIYFNFPPPPGSNSSRWTAGEVVVYEITSTEAITVDSFNFLSAPGGNSAGPYFAAAHFLSTGAGGADSAWVGVVPVPAAAWLFGSGLLGLVGLARRRS